MKIVGLDAWFTGQDCEYENFDSSASILDYDVVFWDPENTFNELLDQPLDSNYNGVPTLTENTSARFRRRMENRRKEIDIFLKNGGTLVVFMAENKRFNLHTGKTEYSGTGRNRAVTKLVEGMELQKEIIPIGTLSITDSFGSEMRVIEESLNPAWRSGGERWQYRALIEAEESKPLVKIARGEALVGLSVESGESGKIFLLPDLTGPDHDEDSEASPDYAVSSIIEWIKYQKTNQDEPQPSWANELKVPGEKELIDRLEEIEVKIEQLSKESEEIREKATSIQKWKRLLTAQGRVLETQVSDAFQLLGFATSDGPIGRTDIHLEHPSGATCTVEVKGLSKSAAEKHAAQLEKWVAEDIENGKNSKPILIANTWRHLDPKERKEDSFPKQMIPYSTKRNHCLMSGLQLFNIVCSILEGTSVREDIVRKILETEGVFEGWDKK